MSVRLFRNQYGRPRSYFLLVEKWPLTNTTLVHGMSSIRFNLGTPFKNKSNYHLLFLATTDEEEIECHLSHFDVVVGNKKAILKIFLDLLISQTRLTYNSSLIEDPKFIAYMESLILLELSK